MIKLSSILILFFALTSRAQNYQCLQGGAPHYFINGNGYLRGIRIDSVSASGADLIYYPYHSPRGPYFGGPPPLYTLIIDSDGGSWLGKKVTAQPDGTFLFDNIWHDTVVIKTWANPGDSWIFFDDTTNISYLATVTAIYPMSVLGTPDSVKVITLTADSAGMVNYNDPLNNFQILLSKNHGFVQAIDLMTFPYHKPGLAHPTIDNRFYDYYLDLVLNNLGFCDIGSCPDNPPDTINSVFHLVALHNPTFIELYNFSAGDVFESSMYHWTIGHSTLVTATTLDTVTSVTTTPTLVTIHMAGHESDTTFYAPGVVRDHHDAPAEILADTTHLIKQNKMPEEWNAKYFYHYFPDSASTPSPCNGDSYIVDNDNVIYDSAIIPMTGYYGFGMGNFDVNNHSYTVGLGETSAYYDYIDFAIEESHWYTYVYKSGAPCFGIFNPIPNTVGALEVTPATALEIFPNPATGFLALTSGKTITAVTITSLTGLPMYSQMCNNTKVEVDVSMLPPGMYLVRVNDEVRKFVKE